MSRKVRVSAIAENHRAYDGSRDFERITKTESDFIIGEIEKVIPESPDLIVLPEVYDRPGGIPRDTGCEYYRFRGNFIYDKVKETAKNNNVNTTTAKIAHITSCEKTACPEKNPCKYSNIKNS